MALTVIEMGEVPDEALPVGELAAQMRLADGATDDPAQAPRLRSRLRAAIDEAERRTGKVLVMRRAVLVGYSSDARRVSLPISPVGRVMDATVQRGGADVVLGGVDVEAGTYRPAAVLADPVRDTEFLTLTVEAGYGAWEAVPPGIRQAVLLIAEALDAGEGEVLTPMAATLLAPHRLVRIGRKG